MKLLEDLNQVIERCVHCGACKSSCPTFNVEQREWASARGKISLCHALIRGEIGLSPKFIKAISECLTCGACREGCPNDVDVPSIIHSARNEVVREKGLPFAHSLLLRRVLDSPDKSGLIPLAIKTASRLQGLFFKMVSEDGGCQRRFPIPLIDRRRLVPLLAKRSFLSTVRGHSSYFGIRPDSREEFGFKIHNPQSTIRNRPRIALFVGCLINYTMPNIGEATLQVLEKVGAEVMVPEGQGCCGMPALNSGDIETARLQAMKVLKVFENLDVDFITTACATCGSALKVHIGELLGNEDEETRKRAEVLSFRVRDITELLVNELDYIKTDNRQPITDNQNIVTYHDPCHLSRYQKIKDEPRALIEASGVEFRELSHPCRCCGLGGTFNLKHYDFSMDINREKTRDIVETGADIVTTACPGCIIQLRDGLHQAGIKKEVKHVVELLTNHGFDGLD